MFCRQCGVRIENPDANFCKKCGTKIRKINTSAATLQTNDLIQRARDRLRDITQPRIEKTKNFTADKLESIQQNIEDPNKYKKLSSDQRTYLAQRLSNLRTKISSQSSNEISESDAIEIVQVNEDLLKQIQEDKCLICYKPMHNKSLPELVVCPSCGHGGHKAHILSWFQEKKNCPYCKKDLEISEILMLRL